MKAMIDSIDIVLVGPRSGRLQVIVLREVAGTYQLYSRRKRILGGKWFPRE